MVQYSLAVAAIVALVFPSSTRSFILSGRNTLQYAVPSIAKSHFNFGDNTNSGCGASIQRKNRVAASISAAFNNESDDIEVSKFASDSSLQNINTGESISEVKVEEEDIDEYEAKMERRKKALLERQTSGRTVNYEICIPIVEGSKIQPVEGVTALAPADDMISQQIGLSLREVSKNAVLSEYALDMDSLQSQTFMDEKIRDSKRSTPPTGAGSVQLLTDAKREILDEDFNGLVVSSVVRGGLAWNAGVRVGDKLMASSATMGEVNMLQPLLTNLYISILFIITILYEP